MDTVVRELADEVEPARGHDARRVGEQASSLGQPAWQARRFAVIGAGAAGLAAAKHLLQAGFQNVTVFEIGTRIGGLWCYGNDNGRSSAYRTLHINTARNITNYSDFGFPPDVQLFPSHADMQAYFEAFADQFDLWRHIRFRSQVTSVRPASDHDATDPRWFVDTVDGATLEFDRVVVASGHLADPSHVGAFQDFAGSYLHSHDYKEPEPYLGKRVCVVGIGNSAVDIASDICVNARRTVLVARSGVRILPKLFAGVPFTDITLKLYRRWIPEWARGRALGLLTYLAHGDMRRLGFRPVTEKTHVVSNAVVVSHIAYNRITIKHEIAGIEGRTIRFSDGAAEEFDVLIGATGYRVTLPFLDPSLVPVQDNNVDLYRRIVPPGLPGLYFVGFVNPTAPLNLCFEYQSRWICGIERGLVVLPPAPAMLEAIAAKRAYVRRNYKNSPRHTIEEDHPVYFRELRDPALRDLFPNDLPR